MRGRREDLAYAAGLYEGEGTASAFFTTFTARSGKRSPRKSPQCHVSIGMTDKEPLVKFVDAVGIPTRIYGPYWSSKSTKPFWKICYTGFEKVQAILAMLWAWLSPRRRLQAQKVLLIMRGINGSV